MIRLSFLAWSGLALVAGPLESWYFLLKVLDLVLLKKKKLEIQYFVDFFNKQTNQTFFFSFFNYYQLRMVFFSIIKKAEKIFNHRPMLII